MIDIHFYRKVFDLKLKLMHGEKVDKNKVGTLLEEYRSKEPVIYNIETTNACNMTCEMCPRTTRMTRSVETLDMDTFKNVVDQLIPFSSEDWALWQDFVEEKYGISREGMSENHFFLHIIPKVVVLHGYGDPLLDKYMSERVQQVTDRGLISYFSCNPANIDMDKTINMFENGLGYIKYSIESVNDLRHKEVRGKESDFTNSFDKIMSLLKIKEEKGYDTIIVITMLNLNKPDQLEEFQLLQKAFEGLDVYIYLKSQDQQWYQEVDHGTGSIHWKEFCQFPWSSMTIKSNGEAVECVEDYNNEIILGNVKESSLLDIWNGEKYQVFRENHLNCMKGIKCSERCDMKLIGGFFE